MLESAHTSSSAPTLAQTLSPQGNVVNFLGTRLPSAAALAADNAATQAEGDSIAVFASHDEFLTLQSALAEHGYAAAAAPLRKQGAQAVLADNPPLVLCDVTTPGFSGFDLVRDLRGGGYSGRIFALVERGDLLTSVISLEMGADLVIEKPVQPRLLCSYIKKAMQDKTQGADTARMGVMRFGRLAIDLRGRHVTIGDESIELSGQHFDLLELLARNAGRHVAREQVIEALGSDADLSPRSVDCMVYRLRKRLIEHGISAVTTVRGRGYLFAPRNW
jgi:DNA-binding response OmpR family regulator